MKRIIPSLLLLIVAACAPTHQDVRDYGEERFIQEMLAVADGKPTPEDLLKAIRPIRIERHLNGAWAIIRENDRYQEGIYVDRTSLENSGGSGMELTPWTKQIGWSKEKIRTKARTSASTVPDSRVTPAADAPGAPREPVR